MDIHELYFAIRKTNKHGSAVDGSGNIAVSPLSSACQCLIVE